MEAGVQAAKDSEAAAVRKAYLITVFVIFATDDYAP